LESLSPPRLCVPAAECHPAAAPRDTGCPRQAPAASLRRELQSCSQGGGLSALLLPRSAPRSAGEAAASPRRAPAPSLCALLGTWGRHFRARASCVLAAECPAASPARRAPSCPAPGTAVPWLTASAGRSSRLFCFWFFGESLLTGSPRTGWEAPPSDPTHGAASQRPAAARPGTATGLKKLNINLRRLDTGTLIYPARRVLARKGNSARGEGYCAVQCVHCTRLYLFCSTPYSKHATNKHAKTCKQTCKNSTWGQ